MGYEVDGGYPFAYDECGIPCLPATLDMDGSLYVLPNGKYLPRGLYRTDDGERLIYEPPQLSPFADMLAEFGG